MTRAAPRKASGSRARRLFSSATSLPLCLFIIVLLFGGGPAAVRGGMDVTSEHPSPALGEMLACVSDLFAALKIDYFIADGSLLAAVRNNTFVPWDTDIDVVLLPGELKKLERHAHNASTIAPKTCGKPPIQGFEITKIGVKGRHFTGARIMSVRRLNMLHSPHMWGDIRILDKYKAKDGSSFFSLDYKDFKTDDILPTAPCLLSGIPVRCPARPKVFIVETYGKDWRTPCFDMYDKKLKRWVTRDGFDRCAVDEQWECQNKSKDCDFLWGKGGEDWRIAAKRKAKEKKEEAEKERKEEAKSEGGGVAVSAAGSKAAPAFINGLPAGAIAFVKGPVAAASPTSSGDAKVGEVGEKVAAQADGKKKDAEESDPDPLASQSVPVGDTKPPMPEDALEDALSGRLP